MPTKALAVLTLSGLPLTAKASNAIPDMSQQLGQLLFGLAVVITLLFGTLWLIKKLSGSRGNARGMRIVGGMPISTRERIVVVEAADKVLVLGIGGGSINTLHTFEADQWHRHQDEYMQTGAAPNNDFSHWLSRALNRRRQQPEKRN